MLYLFKCYPDMFWMVYIFQTLLEGVSFCAAAASRLQLMHESPYKAAAIKWKSAAASEGRWSDGGKIKSALVGLLGIRSFSF